MWNIVDFEISVSRDIRRAVTPGHSVHAEVQRQIFQVFEMHCPVQSNGNVTYRLPVTAVNGAANTSAELITHLQCLTITCNLPGFRAVDIQSVLSALTTTRPCSKLCVSRSRFLCLNFPVNWSMYHTGALRHIKPLMPQGWSPLPLLVPSWTIVTVYCMVARLTVRKGSRKFRSVQLSRVDASAWLPMSDVSYIGYTDNSKEIFETCLLYTSPSPRD